MKLILMSGGNRGLNGYEVDHEDTIRQAWRAIQENHGDSECWLNATQLLPASFLEEMGIRQTIQEPAIRGTFPSIAYSVSYLTDMAGVAEDELCVFLPVHRVSSGLLKAVAKTELALHESGANLAIVGSTSCGKADQNRYIVASESDSPHWRRVVGFKEYSDREDVRNTNESLCDCGVYAFRPSFFKRFLREKGYPWNYFVIHTTFHSLPAVNFNYAVVEQTKNVVVVPLEETTQSVINE